MTVENKRVYELAKEYGMGNKEFIEYLDTKLDIKVKSHSSNLLPSQIDKIRESFSKKKDGDNTKKPKAFIIKKAKTPQAEAPAEVKEEVKKEQPKETVIVKSEVKQPAVKEETKQPVNVENKEETPAQQPVSQIRSLLEYNNRNSQKRRQEMMAQSNKERQMQAEKQKQEQKQPITPKFARPASERPERPDRESFNKGDRRPFDRNRPDGKVRSEDNREKGERPERTERSERPAFNKKPLQHHVIPQDIYDGKSGQNQGSKKKGPKDNKKKQYKNKEEEQELISLEKAISQKHKKKAKDNNDVAVITQVVINQPITVGELSEKIGKSPAEIVKFLMMQGTLTTVNETISVETQKKICENFELTVLEEDLEQFMEEELAKEEKAKAISEVDESLLSHRAPVISIMGHVDQEYQRIQSFYLYHHQDIQNMHQLIE